MTHIGAATIVTGATLIGEDMDIIHIMAIGVVIIMATGMDIMMDIGMGIGLEAMSPIIIAMMAIHTITVQERILQAQIRLLITH